MNPENGTPSLSMHLPLAVLALTAAVFLGTQIGAVKRGSKTINWQLGNTEKQITVTRDAQKQFVDALAKREEVVKQSGKVQEQYTALLNDVIDLAKTDEDARKIVAKWGIQRQNPPAAASPSPEAAKPTPAP